MCIRDSCNGFQALIKLGLVPYGEIRQQDAQSPTLLSLIHIDVYKRQIMRQKLLFMQAPTGVGKTISTIFPAVKAVGEELADRIFYLTAKTITCLLYTSRCV